MRLFLGIILSLFFSFSIFSQEGKIRAVKSTSNKLYVGIDNNLRVINKLVPLASLHMFTDNGKIYKEESGFVIHPEKPGIAKIQAFTIYNEDSTLIAESELNVVDYPKPKLVINGRVINDGDFVSKYELINSDSLGIGLHFTDDIIGINSWYEIISFSIGWVYGNHYLDERSAGTRLNEDCKELVSKIPSGTETIIRVVIRSNNIVYAKRPIFRFKIR